VVFKPAGFIGFQTVTDTGGVEDLNEFNPC
jgi:hypothetical protein